jgi:hypothetical protein
VAVRIDPTLKPAVATIASAKEGGPERPVARFVGETGVEADLVLDELLVGTTDRAKLDALVSRWKGKILGTADTVAAGLQGATPLYHVQVDPSAADAAKLLADLSAKTPSAKGNFRVSHEAAQKLLAVALTESDLQKITVSPNWILIGMGIPEGRTIEALRGTDGFTSNAFTLPYMTRGGPQDIGVGAAWQALAASGGLSNKVKALIWDAGFMLNPDYPDGPVIFGSRFNTPGAGTCGGRPCPWHGTGVAGALAGKPDNMFGGVGPAGPVADLVLVATPSSVADWVVALMGGAGVTLVGIAGERPRIINMSFGIGIDFGWEVLSALFGPPLGVVMSGFTSAIHATGTLMFAAAGNENRDVDAGDGSINGVLHVPCELAHVICVGGMEHDKINRDPGSNHGSSTDENSVDIYGPYSVWTGLRPPGMDGGDTATLTHGTSISSPFVAGVAALIWAAKPTLSQDDVWTILRETAHVGGVGGTGHQRRVNAFGAVQRALGGNTPPFIRIERPTEGATIRWRAITNLGVLTYDLDDGAPAVAWTSDRDGALGMGASVYANTLSVGTHRLTATATAGGRSATASVNVIVQNDAPTVTIREPAAGASFCTTDAIRFTADVVDPNNNPATFPFPPGGIAWSSTPTGLTGTGSAITRTLPAGSYTARVRVTDEQSASAEATVSFSVTTCTNYAPVVMISSPADVAGSGPDASYVPSTSDANGYYQTVTLTGSAMDMEDGALTGASLEWSSNRGDLQPGGVTTGSQVLGTGTSITVKLYTSCLQPYGGSVDHVITLKATDSNGNVRTVSRIIRVGTLC